MFSHTFAEAAQFVLMWIGRHARLPDLGVLFERVEKLAASLIPHAVASKENLRKVQSHGLAAASHRHATQADAETRTRVVCARVPPRAIVFVRAPA